MFESLVSGFFIFVSNIEQVLEAIPHKAAAVRPPTANHENYPS